MKAKSTFSITKIKPLLKNIILLTFLVFVGLTLRLTGLSWDSGFYLHPDERFLTMVTLALKLPNNLLDYFNPGISTLNPHNNNFDFYVYGQFPLTLAKILANFFKFNNYENFFVLGRILSAFFDTSTIGAVFFLTKNILKEHKQKVNIAFYSGLLYGVFVLPIQQSHFFTVDTFLVAAFTWALVFAFRANTFFTAFFIALGMATKINFIFTLPLIVLLFAINHKQNNFYLKLLNVTILGTISYTLLRLFNPYIFQNPNFFNLTPNIKFIANLKTLQALSNNTAFFPPNLQWFNKSFFFPLKNIFFFGLGPAFSMLVLVGILYTIIKININKVLKDNHHLSITLLIVWSVLFFVYQSSQTAKTMRYFYLLYPLFAVFAGIALNATKYRWVKITLYFLGIIWTLMFMNIYLQTHSRVTASKWLYKHAPNRSKFIVEYWDDPLPLTINSNKHFELITLDFYQKDNKEKWILIAKTLAESNYIVLSSNRLWAVIPQLPELFPITSRYYPLLLKNMLGFKIEAKFSSYPGFSIGNFNFSIPDTFAEEAFTVYDHPEVIILKKNPNFNSKKFIKTLFKNE